MSDTLPAQPEPDRVPLEGAEDAWGRHPLARLRHTLPQDVCYGVPSDHICGTGTRINLVTSRRSAP